ncbi:amidohydrolase family protein [Martelella alba]|nr:amidohydrolase [Martelella alba]
MEQISPPNSPADLVVGGAQVLTGTGSRTSFRLGGVAVKDGRITAVESNVALLGHIGPETRIVDAEGAILMPGLINTHCHAACAQHRGLIENLALEPWLDEVWKAESRYLTPATSRIGAFVGLAELLLSGVTTVMDMFWIAEPVAEAAAETGIRIATGSWFFDGPGMCGITPDQWLSRAEAFFERWQGHPLVLPGCYPHGSYTVGPDNLKAAFALAEKKGGHFSTHAAETATEQKIIQERYGRSVIHHMDHLGLLDPRTVLAHCVHVDDGEIECLAKSGTTVAHNPVSNLKLGSGIAPVPAMLDAGINVTLGTDSAISGNDTDMWLSMRLAALLPKGVQQDPTVIKPDDVLAMATVNGAKALGLADRLGTIEPGKIADFILVETRAPHAAPIYDLATHIIYAAGKSDVRDVFIAGRQVVEDRRLTTIDLDYWLTEMRGLGQLIARGEPLPEELAFHGF